MNVSSSSFSSSSISTLSTSSSSSSSSSTPRLLRLPTKLFIINCGGSGGSSKNISSIPAGSVITHNTAAAVAAKYPSSSSSINRLIIQNPKLFQIKSHSATSTPFTTTTTTTNTATVTTKILKNTIQTTTTTTLSMNSTSAASTMMFAPSPSPSLSLSSSSKSLNLMSFPPRYVTGSSSSSSRNNTIITGKQIRMMPYHFRPITIGTAKATTTTTTTTTTTMNDDDIKSKNCLIQLDQIAKRYMLNSTAPPPPIPTTSAISTGLGPSSANMAEIVSLPSSSLSMDTLMESSSSSSTSTITLGTISTSISTPITTTTSTSSLSPPTTITTTTATTTTTRKRYFSKELRCMMYGFGDDLNPYTETVDMIEDLVLQFISDICIRAMNIGTSDHITIDDLFFILRKDEKKYARLKDLLEMNHELRQARKAFDEISYLNNGGVGGGSGSGGIDEQQRQQSIVEN